ncbi:hypothetical protein A33K_18680 [Burkholderia humptydooensis MSMB43]|uniref:Uncharacterized protein n=1 Tax=Burkholderia humptydooensis MSMB43 TaxID=441157 RepID=A0ABN0FXI2_9BURK|nr:hypothetical protein A33K_18680 [Burkholderia humptydooensis MSMB43]
MRMAQEIMMRYVIGTASLNTIRATDTQMRNLYIARKHVVDQRVFKVDHDEIETCGSDELDGQRRRRRAQQPDQRWSVGISDPRLQRTRR